MDCLEFIASLVGSLAWPSAIVICVLTFRKRILALLPHLRLSHGDLAVTFEKRLESAEDEARQLPEPLPQAAPTPEEQLRFEQIARLSPRAGILELRATLDTAIRDFAKEAGLSLAQRGSLTGLIRELRAQERIDPTVSALLDDLRAIGNRAAHPAEGQEFTLDEALRYRDLTDKALASLDASRAQLPF